MSQWKVRNKETGKETPVESRSEAEEKKAELEGLVEVEIIPPGSENDGDSEETIEGEYGTEFKTGNEMAEEDAAEPEEEPEPEPEPEEHPTLADCYVCGEAVPIEEARSGKGGKPAHGECITSNEPEIEADPAEPAPEPPQPAAADGGPEDTVAVAPGNYDLEERSVGTDPFEWLPGGFVDHIDGSPAINRKGYAVLAHFYKIEVEIEVEIFPEDTEFEHCRVKAIATDPNGKECIEYGTSHTERGDNPYMLLELAITRAKKRALAEATGVGAVAVEELKNEVE